MTLDVTKPFSAATNGKDRPSGGPGYTIKQEFNAKLHEAGVLSMARANDPNSAGSQFFVCLGRVPRLDNQYTVFGKTADKPSLDVVLKIGGVPTGSGDRPKQDVKITSSRVIVIPKASPSVSCSGMSLDRADSCR